jgi:hypothetical protein
MSSPIAAMSVGGKFVSLWVFEVDDNVEGPSSLGILFLIKNLSILVNSTHTQNSTWKNFCGLFFITS